MEEVKRPRRKRSSSAQVAPAAPAPPREAGARLGRWAVVILLIVAALVATRFWDLGNRSFGHDESIHAWEAWKLVTGQGYTHDPVYHGPFGYHLVALVYMLFGIGEVQARYAPALFSVILVLLVWPMRRWLGKTASVFAMALLTISPTLMLRGRYFRHDIWLLTAFMVITICIFRYLEDRKEHWLYLMAGSLAVAFASKAISFITGFIFGTFLVGYLLIEWFRTRKSLKELPALDLVVLLGTLVLPQAAPILLKLAKLDPLDYSSTALVRTTIIVLLLILISAVIGTWNKRRAWLISAGIYYLIFILLYSTLLTNPRGVATGMVGMLGYWLSQQGVARGGQPWYYFYFLNIVYEYLPLLLSGMGAVYFFWRTRARDDKSKQSAATVASTESGPRPLPFVPFLIWWIAGNFLIWTLAGEKMPWQNMHLVVPLGLLAGWFLGRIWDNTSWAAFKARGGALAAALVPLAVLSVIGLLSAVLGPTRPFAGMTLAQLTITMRALLSVLVLAVCVVVLVRRCSSLGAGGWGRLALATVVLVLTATTVRDALRASFSNQDYPTEFLMYADSSPDTALVMADLNKISARLAGDQELKIAYDNESSWPFVWLLRNYRNTTFFTADSGLSGDPQVVIVGPPNEEKVQAQLKTKYIKRQYRLIWWPNQDIYAGMTPAKIWKDLRDPARRRYWWDIFWSRKYPQSTTSWPYVHPFSLYVRKDVAAQLWDFGPEIAGAEVELPEDVYEKKRIDVPAVAAFGTSGSGNGQFNDPKGVALDAAGNIYVVDTRNYRVQVLNSEGAFQRAWGSQGSGPGQFQEPWGIAVDKAGFVYVADTWNHRVQKFDSTGKFIKTWGTFGDVGGVLGDPLLLYGPRGIVVDSQNNVLVSDTGNKRIVKYTSDGVFVQQWGGSGSVEGQFREPCGVAMDANDGVYVADVWNQRVQEFDRNGSYQAQWSVIGWESEAPVNKPYLAIGSQGSVYVTQPDYHRVVKFNGGGQVVAMWGRFGSDDLGLSTPSGIAVDAAGFIYVADSGNNRVVKYAPMN